MKKYKVLGILVLVLLLCVITGCSTDDDDDKPASMTFVDDITNICKELIVYDNFNFKVTFITPSAMEYAMTIRAGDTVSGKITDTGGASWNSNLSGAATQMSSSNTMIDAAVGSMDDVAITISYVKADGAITGITLTFLGSGVPEQAQLLMGGTYDRKK